MFKRIAVALDGSECAQQALEIALELACEQGATLGICSVVEPLFLGAAAVPPPSVNVTMRDLQRAAHDVIGEALETARKRGVNAVGETRSGSPARELLKYAESFNAGLIVMGTHGRRGFSRLLAGSVAEDILQKAYVPVILVRENRVPQCVSAHSKRAQQSPLVSTATV